MTKLLCLDDTYQSHCNGLVTGSGQDEKGHFLIFDQTIFYPQGGGQPSDTGRTIFQGQEILITKVRKTAEGQVRHYVDGLPEQDLTGQELELELNSKNRLEHAKLHTAGHLISVIAEKMHPQIKGVKGHHFPGEAYVEFDKIIENQEAFASDLENLCQKAISDDLKIECKIVSESEFQATFGYSPQGGALRMAIIGNFPPVPCGGTHVASLKELEKVSIPKIKNKKDRMKVSYKI